MVWVPGKVCETRDGRCDAQVFEGGDAGEVRVFEGGDAGEVRVFEGGDAGEVRVFNQVA
jgi:hypothetical protein